MIRQPLGNPIWPCPKRERSRLPGLRPPDMTPSNTQSGSWAFVVKAVLHSLPPSLGRSGIPALRLLVWYWPGWFADTGKYNLSTRCVDRLVDTTRVLANVLLDLVDDRNPSSLQSVCPNAMRPLWCDGHL